MRLSEIQRRVAVARSRVAEASPRIPLTLVAVIGSAQVDCEELERPTASLARHRGMLVPGPRAARVERRFNQWVSATVGTWDEQFRLEREHAAALAAAERAFLEQTDLSTGDPLELLRSCFRRRYRVDVRERRRVEAGMRWVWKRIEVLERGVLSALALAEYHDASIELRFGRLNMAEIERLKSRLQSSPGEGANMSGTSIRVVVV